jgi:hypothetical protein
MNLEERPAEKNVLRPSQPLLQQRHTPQNIAKNSGMAKNKRPYTTSPNGWQTS